MILAIPQNEIVAVDDVDLSAGAREVALGYDDLRRLQSATRGRPTLESAGTNAAIAEDNAR